jgi:Tol biopolymer transport system component
LALDSGAVARLTLGKDDNAPIWSPDGSKLYYSATRGTDQYAVVERAADGSGAERTIFSDRRRYHPASVSPDGRYLLLSASAGGTSSAFAIPVAGGQPARILGDAAPNPAFSPDGRWVVYEVRRRMRMVDVIARATPKEAGGPGGEAAFQISRAGGTQPVWRGKDIFYIAPDGKMMKAPVDSGEALRVGTPEALFDTGIRSDVGSRPRQYDVSPDGKLFLFREDVNIGGEPPMSVILNWQKLLK